MSTRVYFEPPSEPSIAVDRIHAGLRAHLPADACVVPNRRDATLVILTVIGRCERISELAAQIRRRGQRYAVIQLCVRSTQKKETQHWSLLWADAQVVWSYYDLRALCREDGNATAFNFYHAPLGVSDPFRQYRLDTFERAVTVLSSGRSWLVESIRECVTAARRVGGVPLHLGCDLRTSRNVTSFVNITDLLLAEIYRHCQFVSGLRRIEGFELPAAEGLLMGACPIFFDRPHYRQWFDGVAVFIPELDRESTITSLMQVFRAGPPVRLPEHLHSEVAARFAWDSIAKGFWDRC